MKKVSVHANVRALEPGSFDYVFYVDNDATDDEIKQKIEEYQKINYEYDIEEYTTVREFCLKKTKIGELCVFRDNGYIVDVTQIDSEDMFTIRNSIIDKKVKSDKWGTLTVTTKFGSKIDVPCHYIDF